MDGQTREIPTELISSTITNRNLIKISNKQEFDMDKKSNNDEHDEDIVKSRIKRK